MSEDPASVGANSCSAQKTSAITGKTRDDLVFLFPPPGLPPGLVVANAIDVNDTSLASYRLCNVTGAAINAPTLAFRFLIIRV